MPVPAWTPGDLLAAWQRLLPRGRAWRRDPYAVITQTCAALMPTFWRLVQSATNLLVETFPATATAMLSDWEQSLGLPDLCSPLGETIQQRQAAVVQRLAKSGGQSVPYFEGVALTLGFVVTITEGAPATRTWTINIPSAVTPEFFSAGGNSAGDLLEDWQSNTQFECIMNALKPADTVLLFNYV